MRKYWLFLFPLVYTIALHGQPALTDKLRQELRTSPNDTNKVRRLSIAIKYLPFNQPDSGLYYADSIIRLSEKLDYPFGTAIGYFQKGYSYACLGDYSEAMHYAKRSLRIQEASGDLNALSPANLTLSQIYSELEDYPKALAYMLERRKMLVSLGDSMYNRLHDQVQPTNSNIAVADYEIAHTYLAMGITDSALIYGKQALSFWKSFWSAVPLLMGDIYSKIGHYQEALQFYNTSTEIRQPLDSAKKFLGKAYIFQQLGQEDSCLYFAKLALDMSRKTRHTKGIMQASEILSRLYEGTNPGESLAYLKLSIVVKDSLYNKRRVNQVNSIAFNDELRRLDIIAADKAARNRYKIWFLGGGVFTLLVAGFLLWRNNLHKRKANTLLQQEKQTVEQTLEKLKSTQSQLIQSEKMASLGELTAGIAHEIQNPLNFVNNFSDVNTELVDELQAALKKGNAEQAFSISSDIKENQNNINHHGKRADSIVKGMLQHSRASTGQKDLTNINALADEYLRLSYHGLRAKDKSFNAILKTHFDGTVSNINIVPQDIGRVLLNLYNNAFYAVMEKKNQHPEGYQPSVAVSTKKIDSKVEVKVEDNGSGIPQKVLEKIYQPFFTTKPPGQGTGLGLSLAYDIIKAHGGEISVKSKEGEGTEFIIQLPFS